MNVRAGLLTAGLLVIAAACNGDDDADTTLPTDPPTTTSAAPTTPSTSATTQTTPPTTTQLVVTLPTPPPDPLQVVKDQITADYLAAEQDREDLNRNPTLEGLEARVATIAVAGSPSSESLLAFVRGMVERGERIVPGDPDYSEITVEQVELADPASTTATLTVCVVTNAARIGPAGVALEDSGILYAARLRQPVQLTESGWLLSDQPQGSTVESGVITCALG